MNLHFSEVAPQGWKRVNKDFTQTTFGGTSSGLYYKCAYNRNWWCSLPS